MDLAANWAQIVGVSIPIVAALWAGFRWVYKKSVEQIISEMTIRVDRATYPIQPTANGGNSLPDVVRLTKEVLTGQGLIHEKVNEVAKNLAHLQGRFDQHVDEINR